MCDERGEADFTNLLRDVPLQKQMVRNLWMSVVVKTDVLKSTAGTRCRVQVYPQRKGKKAFFRNNNKFIKD